MLGTQQLLSTGKRDDLFRGSCLYPKTTVCCQGENLAYFKPYKDKCQGMKREDCVQCREIIDDWYGEVKNYDFGMGKPKTPGGVVMHFTQVPVREK